MHEVWVAAPALPVEAGLRPRDRRCRPGV